MKKISNNKILISIIVCTYNRVYQITDCINSLLFQTYDKSNYEIIVVDDGSTDNTYSVLSKINNINIIKHDTNLGIGYSRNTGLNNAKGDIIAFTDDDCIPSHNWLDKLYKPYLSKNIVGVGGLTLPYNKTKIIERYLFESGYGNPAPIDFGKSNNIIKRFIIYLKDMIYPITQKKNIVQVQDIYTLNASFRKKILMSIGGFDTNLKSSEDVDLCARINKQYNKAKIVFTNEAIIYHNNQISYLNYLKQTFFRSEYTLRLYNKNNKFPPIFPFPLIIIAATLSTLFYINNIWIFVVLLLPQLLYIWWLLKYLKTKQIVLLLYPYIQFTVEIATILGLLRGYIKNKYQGNLSL